MMNAAATLARHSAARHSRRPLHRTVQPTLGKTTTKNPTISSWTRRHRHPLLRTFATDPQATAAEAPPTTFSSYEFPDRDEAPVITRTNYASDNTNSISTSTTPRKNNNHTTPSYAQTPPNSKPILPTAPAYIPSNIPQSKLEIPETKITTLSNGVRVGSIETYSQVSTVGVLLDFGSRHELDATTTTSTATSTDTNDDDPNQHHPQPTSTATTTISTAGVNHLLELLAFQSTKSHSSASIRSIMETLGAATFATSSREQMMYCVDVLRPNTNVAFDILSEVILCPNVQVEEVEEMKRVMEFQFMDMMPQILLGEGLQIAGYGKLSSSSSSDDTTPSFCSSSSSTKLQQLGRPHFCTAEALPYLTAESVHLFREQNVLHNPHGLVVAGSGMEHEALVELAEKNFGHMTAAATDDVVDDDAANNASANPNEAPSNNKNNNNKNNNNNNNNNTPNIKFNNPRTIPSIYTGGEFRLQTPPNPNPAKEEFTHVALAFEVGGWHSPDIVPICVLQTLLGGGSSFSAGGPGKGMYSRLYREVLNRFRWAESAEAFSSFHAESGLWGISGSCTPDKARELTYAIAGHLGQLAVTYVTDEELSRAKNMLKCNVLTQLESRLVLFEDIGRQILTYGKREDAASMCAKIEAVTKEDIMEVVRKAVVKTPTLSTVGIDIGKVPRLEEVCQWLGQQPPSSAANRKSWF